MSNIPKQEDLDWVQLRKDMDVVLFPETMSEKFVRKFGDNPLIPIGAAATVGALSYGIYSMMKGRSQMSQYMMRTRVVAQGFTVLAVLISLTGALQSSAASSSSPSSK